MRKALINSHVYYEKLFTSPQDFERFASFWNAKIIA